MYQLLDVYSYYHIPYTTMIWLRKCDLSLYLWFVIWVHSAPSKRIVCCMIAFGYEKIKLNWVLCMNCFFPLHKVTYSTRFECCMGTATKMYVIIVILNILQILVIIHYLVIVSVFGGYCNSENCSYFMCFFNFYS